jgi:hypothetical protein
LGADEEQKQKEKECGKLASYSTVFESSAVSGLFSFAFKGEYALQALFVLSRIRKWLLKILLTMF